MGANDLDSERNTNEGALCCRLPLFSFCSCFYILPPTSLYTDRVCVRVQDLHTHILRGWEALSSQSIWPTKVLLLSCVCTYRETTLFNADARRRANNAHTQTLGQKTRTLTVVVSGLYTLRSYRSFSLCVCCCCLYSRLGVTCAKLVISLWRRTTRAPSNNQTSTRNLIIISPLFSFYFYFRIQKKKKKKKNSLSGNLSLFGRRLQMIEEGHQQKPKIIKLARS